jgi:hypothetical protein
MSRRSLIFLLTILVVGVVWGDGEFLTDTCISLVPTQGDQAAEAVAFDGANFFVVWTDARLGTDDVFGARVSQTGRVLDVDGIPLATGDGGQSTASVAFDGTNYLVVYEDYQGSFQIRGVRVSPSGTVLDSAGFVICQGPTVSFPSVAPGCTDLLVVWQDYRNDTADIYGARVTPDGTVLDPQGLALSRRAAEAWTPDVAFDGMNFLVVWRDDRNGYDDVYATRVTQGGLPMDPDGISVCSASNHQWAPSVAFGDGCYLVAWEDRRGVSSDVYAARVTPAGTVLDPGGISVCTGVGVQWYPSVAFDGTNFLIGWGDWRDDASVFTARVTSTGSVLDPDGRRISHSSEYADRPKLAHGDTLYLASWVSGSFSRDVRAARVSSSCTPLDTMGFLVTASVNSQRNPTVALSGMNYLVVWSDERAGSRDIYGARIGPTGMVLDSQAFEISTAVRSQDRPAAAFDGTNTLVVWEDTRDTSFGIYGARVTPDGTVLDPQGIAVRSGTDTYFSPSVAFDGENYLVVWEHFRIATYPDIHGVRITPAGSVLDSQDIVVSATPASEDYSSVSFDGSAFLVVWQDLRNGSAYDVYGARVSTEGVVLDPAGIAVSTADRYQGLPVAVAGGENSLVVWADSRRTGEDYDIYGARVTRSGVVLDSTGVPVSTAPGRKLCPRVASDGAGFVVVWQDDGGDTAYDLRGARIAPSGTVTDSFPVVVQEGGQQYPALAGGRGRPMLLAFQGFAGVVGGKMYNTDRIWGMLDPGVGIGGRDRTPFVRARKGVTVCRGMLHLPTRHDTDLLDITGRRVLSLQPGDNDIRRLAPGVYFVRSAEGGERSVVRKVVIQR